LTSGATSLVINSKLYSTADGSLRLQNVAITAGSDPFLGTYNATTFNWQATVHAHARLQPPHLNSV
jgi:hypothetical protein